MATSYRHTVDKIADQIIGTLAQDRNASGGSVPDRLKSIIRHAGAWIWDAFDWKHKRKTANLVTVASTATATLATDFGELDQRRMHDNANAVTLRFTEDAALWQAYHDQWESGYEAEPCKALIVRKTSEALFTWNAMLSPVPDAIYTFPYWYTAINPWYLAEPIGDTTVVYWPATFDEGWLLRASYRAQRAFESNDRWKDTRSEYRDWLTKQLADNDETITFDDEPIADAYGDFALTGSAARHHAGDNGLPVL